MVTTLNTQGGRKYPQLGSTYTAVYGRLPLAGTSTFSPSFKAGWCRNVNVLISGVK